MKPKMNDQGQVKVTLGNTEVTLRPPTLADLETIELAAESCQSKVRLTVKTFLAIALDPHPTEDEIMSMGAEVVEAMADALGLFPVFSDTRRPSSVRSGR
jgi:hypothetical protein